MEDASGRYSGSKARMNGVQRGSGQQGWRTDMKAAEGHAISINDKSW